MTDAVRELKSLREWVRDQASMRREYAREKAVKNEFSAAAFVWEYACGMEDVANKIGQRVKELEKPIRARLKALEGKDG